MNHATFPPPFGTWYSRYAHIYAEVPQPAVEIPENVTELPGLPRLTTAA